MLIIVWARSGIGVEMTASWTLPLISVLLLPAPERGVDDKIDFPPRSRPCLMKERAFNTLSRQDG